MPRPLAIVGQTPVWRRAVVTAVNSIMNGGVNCTGEITLEASTTTTTLADPRLGIGSAILFMPLTANAAAELYTNGTMYVSAQTKGAATVTHANNAQTDRTFRYVILTSL